jgi:hypothetical protein
MAGPADPVLGLAADSVAVAVEAVVVVSQHLDLTGVLGAVA